MESFEILQQLDLHFQQQHAELLSKYERQQHVLQSNKETLLAKLKAQYETTIQQLKGIHKNEKALLLKNSEKAKKQVEILYENKNKFLIEKQKGEVELYEKNIIQELQQVMERKQLAERTLYNRFETAQNAQLIKVQKIEQMPVCQQMITQLREAFQEQILTISQHYEEHIEQLLEKHHNQIEVIEEKYINFNIQNEYGLEATIQKLEDELMEQLHKEEERYIDCENMHYNEFLMKEENFLQQFEAEEIKLDELFLTEEKQWEQAYNEAYMRFKQQQ